MANVSDMLTQAIGPQADIMPGPDADVLASLKALTPSSAPAQETSPFTADYVFAPPAGGHLPSSDYIPQTVEQKKADVVAASLAKQAAMGGGATPYQIAVGQQSGQGSEHASLRENDMRNLNPSQLYAKYGGEATNMLLSRASGSFDLTADASVPARDPVNAAADTLAAGATGFVSSLGGLGALGAGLVNDTAGTAIAGGLQDLNKFVDSTQSEKLQASKRINEARNFLTTRDNAAQQVIDAQTDGELVSSLKQIGRDAIDSVGNAGSDVTVLGDGISSALGSLFAAGPVGKGIKAIGSALIPKATQRGVGLAAVMGETAGGSTAARLLAGAAEHAPTSLAIGGLEAGGAYQQISADIMGRSHDTLMQESPMYQQLIQSGMSQTEAKTEVANRTGLLSAAITAPAAIAAGSLVSKFEGAPLAGRGARQLLGNTARETTEESIQGGTGQLAQNFAEQQTANKNQSLSEGVGRQIGEGGLYGLGSTVAVGAPGVLRDAAPVAAMAAGRTTLAGLGAVAGVAGDALAARADAVQTRNDAASPIADAVVAQAATEAQANAPQAEVSMREAANALPAEQAASANTYVDKLMSATQFDSGEVPASLAPLVAGTTNRVQAIQQLADAVKAAPEGSREELTAGLTMFELLGSFDAIVNSDPTAIDAIPADHPAKAMIAEYDALMANVMNTPKVLAALSSVQKVIDKQATQAPAPITEASLATPQGQEDVRNAIAIASMAPDKASLETNEQILMHAAQGRIQVTPEQKAALDTSVAILRAVRTADEEAKRLGKTDPVSLNIRTEDGVKGKSVVQHAQGVMAAWKAGNTDLATSRLFHLHELVSHMGNKVAALNQHLASGNPKSAAVHYEALNQGLEWFTSEKGLSVNPGNEGSVKFAQKVASEAKLLADVYNGLVSAFPDLDGQHVDVTPLDGALDGPAKEVVAKYRSPVVTAPTPVEDVVVKPAKVPTPAVVQTPVTETVQEKAPITPEPTPVAAVSEPVEKPVVKADVEVVAEVEKPATPVVPAQVTVAEPVLKGMDAVFSELVGGKQNFFKVSFDIPAQARTRTFGSETPFSLVQAALTSSTKFLAFAGSVQGELTKEIAQAYQDYLSAGQGLMESLDDNLQAFLSSKYSKADGRTIGEILATDAAVIQKDGKLYAPLRATKSKVLNLTEPSEDTLGYNPELVQMATLAALQWMITADQYGSVLDTKDVAEITGLEEVAVTDSLMDQMNQGMSVVEAKRTLADKITKYWGVSPSSKGLIGYQEGIAEGMAAELMRVMVDAGLLEQVTIELTEADGLPAEEFRTINRMLPKSLPEGHPLRELPSAIEQAVLVEPEDMNFIGQGNLPKVAQTQLRNPSVRNTDEQLQAIENEQATPYFVNPHMAGFYNALGVSNLVKMFGAGDISNKALNVNHAKTLDGQNRTTVAAFNNLTGLLAEVNNQGPLEQTPIHYAFNMTRVSRLQMLGKYNPQASKLVREVILPTRSTLDLSSQTTEDYRRFGLGLAQGLGIKVHKMSQANTLAKLQALFDGPLSESVDNLGQWLKTFDPADALMPKSEIPESTVQTLMDNWSAAGIAPSFVALHAMMEYARWKAAPGQFTTAMYLEADGVTNGPVNAMVLFTPGEFTSDWVKNIAKGGLFFNRGAETVNTHNESVDAKDLYQATTDELKNNLTNLQGSLVDNAPAGEQMNHLLRLMDYFLPDVGFDEQGNLVLQRGVAKNPLTITIYGSGAGGIAAKMSKAITDAIYERMSQVAQGEVQGMPANISAALNKLISIKAKNTRKGIVLENMESDRKAALDPLTFTFTPGEISNLQSNMLHFFVAPMRGAIESTVGSKLMTTASLLQKATQVQSIMLEHAFKQEVTRLIRAKEEVDPEYRASDFLTRTELDGIQKKLDHMAPIIDTGNQRFYIAGSQSADLNLTDFGRALNDEYRTPAFVNGPKDAGVSGIPFLNIGTGDGQMMQTIATMDGAPTGTLKIFDGMHLPLDQIESGSVMANQAVFQSWQANPLKAVHESYSNFIKDADLTQFGTEEKAALVRALLPPDLWTEEVADEDLRQVMEALVGRLNTAQQEIEARHRVMSKVQISVDQMAAASSPYVRDGEIALLGSSPEDVASELNAQYLQELASIQQADTVKTTVRDEIVALATQSDSGAYVLDTDSLKLLSQVAQLPKDQAGILKQITDGLAIKGYSVVFGTVEQVAAYAPKVGLQGVHGFTSIGDKVIYLINPSSETLVHELIHAATFETVLSHYNDPAFAKQNAQGSKAVKRIEALMEQFLTLRQDMTQVSPDLLEAYNDAVSAINNYQRVGNKAAALNEFMSWSLTNEALGRLLKRTRASKLVQLAQDVIASIKSMFGIKGAVGTDMFSNLLFNSSMLMFNQPSLKQRFQQSVLFMNSQYGSDQRLADVSETYANSIGRYLADPIQAGVVAPSVAVADAIMTSYRIGQSFMAHGFPMNMQEASTFSNIVAALATEAKIDPNAMAAAQTLYSYVTKNLKVEDFMADPTDQAQRYYAQQKFDLIMGRYLVEMDIKGRSTLLPAFVALATVDQGFRDVLSKMDLPKTAPNTAGTLDAVLENVGNAAMDKLSERMSGVKQSHNIQEAIDGLNAHVADLVQQRETYIDQMASTAGGVIDRANEIVVDGMTKLSGKLLASASRAQKNAGNRVTRLVTGFGAGIAAVINEPSGQIVSQGVMSAMNKLNVWEPLHTLVNDIVGRTQSNANVYDMIKGVRSMIQQARQQFREHLPSLIADKFSRELSQEEWTSLHRSMGKTDLAVLRNSFSNAQIMDLLTDAKQLDARVSTLETFLQKEDPTHFKLLQNKMVQLAQYMNSGIPGNNLLRNAHAVSNLFGESKAASWMLKGAKFEQAVDHLITLYAIQDLNQGDRTTLASLAQGEAEGLGFTLSYLVGQRAEEQRKGANGVARNNAYKGYLPSELNQGVSMLVAHDSEFGKLTAKSYVRVGDYIGSSLDRRSSHGYYFAPVSARSTFEQGIMQNVRQSVSGVDAKTGYTNGPIAGRITEPATVKAIARNLSRDQGIESLLPVYGDNGQVVAFERSLDPRVMERSVGESNLSKQIGVWRGRQVEEAKAQKFNESLIDALKAMYDKDIGTSTSNQVQYVNLSNPASLDPVLQDAVNLFSPETQAYIEQTFGADFYVRKDMLNDALGYRAASIGDAWTGNSRWSQKTQDTVRNIALSVFGNNAYKTLLTAEKTVNNIVSDAKVLIVVKSVVVPITNLMSNVFQLVGRGVPLAHIVKGMGKKTAEIDAFAKSRIREIEAEAELRAATGNPVLARKLKAEIQSIQDSHRRMSIWPLIQAGEFSSISDAGLTRTEVMLTSGRLQAYIETLVNKLPKPIATLGRYAMVTKDTALFQGLQKAVEYGDFLAKAVLFDDLTQRKKLSSTEALGRITEEFVNYDRLSGRFRGTLENLGLLWFYNFKIRSTKVALSMIRNNPVHTLLAIAAPQPTLFGSVGLPTDSNIFAKLAEGTLDYSVGPGQGLHAAMLNPWVNLTQ